MLRVESQPAAAAAVAMPRAQPVAKGLPEAVRQFEAIFVNLMLKSARAATQVLAADSPFDSFEGGLHLEMFDEELSRAVSRQGGIGLADALLRQLQPRGAASHPAAAGAAAGPRAGAGGSPGAAADGAAIDAGAVTSPGRRHAVPAATVPATPVPWIVASRRAALRPPAQHPTDAAAAPSHAFATPAAFVDAVLPVIERLLAGTTLPPLGVLAQAALETGWGSRVPGSARRSSNNLFGIKSGADWQGERVLADTLEVRDGVARRERASFRAYPDIAASVRDLVAVLGGSPRYAEVARSAQTPAGYARALAAAGYATDPQYARKLQSVLAHPAIRAVSGRDDVAVPAEAD
jgi:flagellar protein FlgJ